MAEIVRSQQIKIHRFHQCPLGPLFHLVRRLGAIKKLIAGRTRGACSILGIPDGLSEKRPLMRLQLELLRNFGLVAVMKPRGQSQRR
jgi:hypothetical protein